MRIAANYIVKNEEMFLRYSLESIKNVVDEIVLIDNGSTDKTIDIAEEFKSKYDKKMIIEQKTDLGFAELRNENAKLSDCDLILIVDGDEVHFTEGANSIQNAIKVFTEYRKENNHILCGFFNFYHFYGSFKHLLAQAVEPAPRLIIKCEFTKWEYIRKTEKAHEFPSICLTNAHTRIGLEYYFAHYGYCKPNQALIDKGKHYLELGHFNHLASNEVDKALNGIELVPYWGRHPSAMNEFNFEDYKTDVEQKGGRFFLKNKPW